MKVWFAILVCIFSSLVAMTLKHNEACNAFSQEVLNNQKRDEIVVVLLADASLAGAVLPTFKSVAKEGFLTRTNDLIADDEEIHVNVFTKTVFQRLQAIDLLIMEKMKYFTLVDLPLFWHCGIASVSKISAQPHTTSCIQFLDRENNDKNNRLPLGKQICFTIVWG